MKLRLIGGAYVAGEEAEVSAVYSIVDERTGEVIAIVGGSEKISPDEIKAKKLEEVIAEKMEKIRMRAEKRARDLVKVR